MSVYIRRVAITPRKQGFHIENLCEWGRPSTLDHDIQIFRYSMRTITLNFTLKCKYRDCMSYEIKVDQFRFNENFGNFGILDRLHGTNVNYRKRQNEKKSKITWFVDFFKIAWFIIKRNPRSLDLFTWFAGYRSDPPSGWFDLFWL